MTEKRKDPLADYVALTGKSDADIARLLGVSRWTVSRGRRGQHPFSPQMQVEIERFSGVSPEAWAGYYAKLVKARKKSAAMSEAS